MIIQEQLQEIAKVRFGDGGYGDKDLKKLESAFKVRKAHNEQILQMPEDEAEEKAIEVLSVPIASKKKGSRGRIIKFVKEALLYFWGQGKKSASASAYEVTMWAVAEGKYHTESPKGVGDTMGKGKGSLFLEAADIKVNGKKALVTPDPDAFPDWYDRDIPLPREYYSEAAWDELNVGDGVDCGSHFLERFL